MSVGESIGCMSPTLFLTHGGFIDFSNILSKTALERLAQVDEYEVVREVQVRSAHVCTDAISHGTMTSQEYFADYAPISPSLFSLNQTPSPSRPLYGSTANSWDPRALELTMQGITAVLLSLRKKPIIRYEKMSPMAKKLGVEIQVSLVMMCVIPETHTYHTFQHRIKSESTLFDFRLTQVPPLLLILDRRNDPVTPLLSQWTYQAMVHELLGIHNGRVDLSRVPEIRPELSVS